MTMGTEDSRWTPAQLQSLWNQMETTIHPFTHVLCLTGDLFRAMDNVAKRFIAEQFMCDLLSILEQTVTDNLAGTMSLNQ